MKKLPCLLVLSGLISVPAFAADAAPASPHTFTGNIGVTSDYIFRGISQTQHKPAVSGGVDYSHSSGLYAGTWLSNQSWVETGPYKTNSSLEWDLYGGYKGAVSDIGYDVGVISYYYPGDRSGAGAGLPTPDTVEAYLGVSWKFLSLKYSHTVSDYFIGWGTDGSVKTKGSNYVELNATPDLGDGWGLIAHVGHQKVKNVGVADYTDWKVGVTKDVGFGTVTAAYSDTDANTAPYTWGASPENVSKGMFAVSFSKSF
jgi:uncharacterized protein (TIGR02001 family)